MKHNDLSLQVGDEVQMTPEGRRLFKPPYSGIVHGVGSRGGLKIIGFGEKEPRPFRPRFWRKLGEVAAAVDEVRCPACGEMKAAREMDRCLGCSRPYEICPKCMLDHACGRTAE